MNQTVTMPFVHTVQLMFEIEFVLLSLSYHCEVFFILENRMLDQENVSRL